MSHRNILYAVFGSYLFTTPLFHLTITILSLSCAGTAGATLYKKICYYREGGEFIFSHLGTFTLDAVVVGILTAVTLRAPAKYKKILFYFSIGYLVTGRLLWLRYIENSPRPYFP